MSAHVLLNLLIAKYFISFSQQTSHLITCGGLSIFVHGVISLHNTRLYRWTRNKSQFYASKVCLPERMSDNDLSFSE